MPTFSNRENSWGQLLALGIALLAGGHWMLALCYSRGYDFFLWLYNAWLLTDGAARGTWPNWSAFSAAGQPAFKMAGVIDAACLGAFIELLGLEAGARVYATALYAVAGLGMYALGRDLSRSVLGGVVASAAYSLSWFLTFTAYYQSYLSNFLSYALMPWCALFFIRAVATRSRGPLLAAAAILFVAITSNAQVAVKVVLFVVPLAYVVNVVNGDVSWRRWGVDSAVLCFWAACWALFLIVPALMMRQEVLLLGEARGNAFIAPWLVLFWIPLYGLNYLCYVLSGMSFLGRNFLAWAVFSDYVGLSVLAVALASWGLYRAAGERMVKGLWLLAGGYFLFYFAAVPNMAASAWVGRTHNWAILPTLVLALLAGFGARHIAARATSWMSPLWSGALVCALIVVDLGGVSFFLNRLAITHTPLEELPEVGIWQRLRAQDAEWEAGSRFFTYNPDHTFYLLPVLADKPVANIIELRTRTWEYDSYLTHQLESMRSLDPTYNAAESLALLDVEYVDIARKLYDYRGDERDFERGLAQLQSDRGLEQLIQRDEMAGDLSYDAYSNDLDLGRIVGAVVEQGRPSQVIFRNDRHFSGFIPEQVVLILGPTRLGQAFFEQVTHLSGYRADRLLFILAESWADLDGEARLGMNAYIPVGTGEVAGLRRWGMRDVRTFYGRKHATLREAPRPTRVEWAAERGVYEIAGNERGTYLFLSQQRFTDWHAYEGERELPVFKAQAGMTAVYLPAGVESVEYRYVLPIYELVARWLSLCGFLFGLGWWLVGRSWRKTCGDLPSRFALLRD
jgi:hypothetical protein